jgi:hypothetical protein
VRTHFPLFSGGEPVSTHGLKGGDVVDGRGSTEFAVARTRVFVVEVGGEKLMTWAQAKVDGRIHAAT